MMPISVPSKSLSLRVVLPCALLCDACLRAVLCVDVTAAVDGVSAVVGLVESTGAASMLSGAVGAPADSIGGASTIIAPAAGASPETGREMEAESELGGYLL